MFEPLCVAFRRGCIDGQRPQIESFVATVAHSRQPLLLARLLTIEVDYRCGIGEQPKIEEYAPRFPDYRAIVDAVLLETGHASQLAESTVEFRAASSLNSNRTSLRSLFASNEVGRYRLIEKLGSGGFGEVWRALDPLLERQVAVKILRPDRPQDFETVKWLQAEARKMADLDLSWPGIVRVLDVGTSQAGFFIVSQLVEGGSLAERLSGPRLSHEAAAELIAAAAEAIHHVHLKGLTHRDLKPANILLDSAGRPHIADFGLAVFEDDQLLEAESTVGTAAYMAPEQAKGESNRVDARTDVWALGVILYQLLCHRLPFKASTRKALYQEILHREARPLRTIDDSIPAELERICLKCLSKPVGERYTTSRDLALDLRRSLKLVAAPAPPRSRSEWLAVAACTVLLISACLIYVRTLWRRADVPIANQRYDVAGDHAPSKPRATDNGDISVPGNDLALRRSSTALFKPLIASLGAKDLTLQALADRTGLRAASGAAELISLGQIDAEDDELEIALNQVPWTGNIGVFFGHGLGVLGDDEVHVFQALVLRPSGNGLWNLIRMRYNYSGTARGDWSSKTLSSTKISTPGKALLALRIRFDRNSVADVTIDGVSKRELCDAALTSESAKLYFARRGMRSWRGVGFLG